MSARKPVRWTRSLQAELGDARAQRRGVGLAGAMHAADDHAVHVRTDRRARPSASTSTRWPFHSWMLPAMPRHGASLGMPSSRRTLGRGALRLQPRSRRRRRRRRVRRRTHAVRVAVLEHRLRSCTPACVVRAPPSVRARRTSRSPSRGRRTACASAGRPGCRRSWRARRCRGGSTSARSRRMIASQRQRRGQLFRQQARRLAAAVQQPARTRADFLRARDSRRSSSSACCFGRRRRVHVVHRQRRCRARSASIAFGS